MSSFVYMLVTDGIGTGIVIGNQLYYGAHCLDGRVGAEIIRINGKWEELSRARTPGRIMHPCAAWYAGSATFPV